MAFDGMVHAGRMANVLRCGVPANDELFAVFVLSAIFAIPANNAIEYYRSYVPIPYDLCLHERYDNYFYLHALGRQSFR